MKWRLLNIDGHDERVTRRNQHDRLLRGVRTLQSLGYFAPAFLLWMIERAEGQEPRITKPFTVGRVEYRQTLFALKDAA